MVLLLKGEYDGITRVSGLQMDVHERKNNNNQKKNFTTEFGV